MGYLIKFGLIINVKYFVLPNLSKFSFKVAKINDARHNQIGQLLSNRYLKTEVLYPFGAALKIKR